MKSFSTLITLFTILFLVGISLDNPVQGQVLQEKATQKTESFPIIKLSPVVGAQQILAKPRPKTSVLSTSSTCNPPCESRFPQCCGNICIPWTFHCCNEHGDYCGRTTKCCGNACIEQDATCCGDSGTWCPDGRACCADNKSCCPKPGQICCGNGCVDEGGVCCGPDHGCGPGNTCCGTACMPYDANCCKDGPPGHWCPDGQQCCGNSCIGLDDTCCGGGYFCKEDHPVCCPGKCCKKNCGCCSSDPTGCCCFGN